MMTICSDRDDRTTTEVWLAIAICLMWLRRILQLHGFRTINISAAIDAGGVIDTSAAAAANGLVMCRSDEDSSNDDDFIASRVGY